MQPEIAKQFTRELVVHPPDAVRHLLDSDGPLLHSYSMLQHEMRNANLSSQMQVAELAVQAIETGRFIARLPDFHSNFIVASSAGVAPRMFPIWLEFLLLPLYFYLHLWLRRMMDRRILAWRKQEAANLAGRSSRTGSLRKSRSNLRDLLAGWQDDRRAKRRSACKDAHIIRKDKIATVQAKREIAVRQRV